MVRKIQRILPAWANKFTQALFSAKSFGTIFAVLAIILWGISFITIKIALEEVKPVTLIVIRFSIGAAIISLFTVITSRVGKDRSQGFTVLSRKDIPALIMVGLIGISLQQLLQVGGQALAPASIAGILAATAPAFTLILAAIFLHEKQTWLQIAGVTLALAGSVVVITNGQFGVMSFFNQLSSFDNPAAWGSILVLLSAVVWAVFTIMSRKVVQDRPAHVVTSMMFAFGVVFVLPVFIYQRGWEELVSVSARGWAAILFTAILCTAGAYLLNNHALKTVSASRVAIIQMLEPLVVMVSAVFVLGETISIPILLGAAAILTGIFLAQKQAAVQ